VENCQVGVFLSSITPLGHTLIDRELYLPQEWIEDRPRCSQAGIPDTVGLRTKPDLAIAMLERLHQAQVPINWVVADSVYGGHAELRMWLETHHYPYVGAVACDEPVVLTIPGGGVRRMEVRQVASVALSEQDWQRLSMSEGSKGPRLFDWACVPLLHRGVEDGWHSLLLRRTIAAKPEVTYYLVFAPPGTPLQAKVSALGGRWRIEENFKNGKGLGMDDYEVRSWTGWYRYITLVMLVLVYLVGICVQEQAQTASSADEPTPTPAPVLPTERVCPDQPSKLAPVSQIAEPIRAEQRSPKSRSRYPPTALWPLSVPEVRHLLAHLLFLPSSSVKLVERWSDWWRWHQSLSSFFHTQRRVKAG
jgi:SRSO17 transposase